MSEITSDNKPGENYVPLLSFLHQFAGSAGMYGYTQISTQCVELQALINNPGTNVEIHNSYMQLVHLIERSADA